MAKIHRGPPPGTMTIEKVCESLGMSRQNFYQSGLPEILDSWQVSKNTSRLYLKEDVGKIKYWLFVRQGQVALSLIPYNYPLKPDFDLDVLVLRARYGAECPQCEGQAVADWETARVWCPECGIIEENSI